MRIVYMGTPDFAVPSLRRLYDQGHEIAAVYTQPDKPKSRGMKLSVSAVKELAVELGLEVKQPATLRDAAVIEEIRAAAPELIAVVAYGKLLPREVLDIPKYGCINIHGSLLPKYRGAAPIQWAVLNGERETGVTSMYLAEEMDAGDIIFTEKTPIGDNETSGELYGRLKDLGAGLIGKTVAAIADGNAPRAPQEHDKATYAKVLTKELSPVNWSKSSAEIINQIRGLNPWPIATAELGGMTLKIFTAVLGGGVSGKAPGEVISAGKNGLEIACGGGSVIITELQAPGKKRMNAADYLRGNPIV